MKGVSCLLAIDGSAEARAAAYFAWDLAERSGAKVLAQHVIDVGAAWRYLSHNSNGFIGNGVYLQAFDSIKSSLYSISEALLDSYKCQLDGRNIESEICVDEGDIVEEIVKRSKDHELLIVGHRDLSAAKFRMQTDGKSVAHELIMRSYCPVLLVQSLFSMPEKIQIWINDVNADPELTQRIRDWGSKLGMKVEFRSSTGEFPEEEKAVDAQQARFVLPMFMRNNPQAAHDIDDSKEERKPAMLFWS
ncbi:MAG: universal stress protein [Candidatus Obscuribacterales bacterium]|nr:universal stress protein [Candidatus Obscuribacterales bacterium]